jgi:hypothetical protein
MKMNKFERITFVQPAYDKRDPDPKKNYGIHGAHLVFILKGELGAVEFDIGTNWYLPHVAKELRTKESFSDGRSWFEPRPYSIGYHSPKPMYEDHSMSAVECKYLDGKSCYFGDSVTYSDVPFQILISEGSEAMWAWMENYYKERFEDKKD